ncbi:MAG: acetyl-CoA carboxylase biotin carboxyl carrier protein subunit [Desulfobacterales bacterium CG23_combo_of_CG06-09_8_20_14_all_52_9]|nr:MAG: acetyl-CoA carboxylase biotin carboxyl carrier protein subunit [Desulfobacterales bacterium CG23_combo_of_CG06-09_8_20_14_all_52_9]
MNKYTLTIGEQIFDVEIGTIQDNLAQVIVNQTPYEVKINGVPAVPPAAQPAAMPRLAPAASQPQGAAAMPKAAAAPAMACSGAVLAPIPGKIIQINVQFGERVTAGQVVALMEAMKMENNLLSPMDGVVKEIRAGKDADVATGDVVMIIV